MGLLKEIFNTSLRRLGYEKQASVAHVPSFPDITPFHKTEDYLQAYKGWVYANVKRRAEQMANVDIQLMREARLGVDEVLDHPAMELLMRVNNQMTQRELLEITYAHLDLAGEAFWHVDRGEGATGEPQSIIPLLPDRVKIVPGDEQLIGGYIYRVTDKDGNPKEIPFEPGEIVFFKEPNPNNLYRGMSAIRAAAQTIDNDESAEKWNWNSFLHGVSSKPVFQTDQVLDEESLKRQYAMLQENWSGVENANKPMILFGGLEAVKTGFSAKDMEYLDSQKWTRDKIMALLGTTKTILGITEDVNRANAETNEFVFAKYMVKPRVEKVIDYLNEFYLPMFTQTDSLFFMVDDPVPPNVEQEVDVFSKALAGGSWMTPNEVREQKGLPTITDGDKLYIPSTLVAIDGEVNPQEERVFHNITHKQRYADRIKREQRDKQLYKKVENEIHGITQELVSENKTIERSFRERASKQGGFHDQMKAFGETQEQKMKKAMQDYFMRQQEFVIQQVQHQFRLAKTWETKAIEDEFLFEKGQFKNIGLQLIIPILEETLRERGNEALFFIGASISYDLSNPVASKFIEEQGANLIENIDETTREKLRNQISEGLDKGEGIPDIQDRVRSVFSKASDSRAEMIARTEVIKASNFASQDAWRQSGVVEGNEWLTARDERVDPLCAAMDGKVISLRGNFFEKGDTLEAGGHKQTFIEDTPVPPAHPMCRCTLIPVLKGEKSIGEVKKRQPGVNQNDVKKLNQRLDDIMKLI